MLTLRSLRIRLFKQKPPPPSRRERERERESENEGTRARETYDVRRATYGVSGNLLAYLPCREKRGLAIPEGAGTGRTGFCRSVVLRDDPVYRVSYP